MQLRLAYDELNERINLSKKKKKNVFTFVSNNSVLEVGYSSFLNLFHAKCVSASDRDALGVRQNWKSLA